MANILNADNVSVKYVSNPGLGAAAQGVLTFNGADVDQALFINSAAINFARAVARLFFLNVDGVAYQIGRGTGTLQVQGLLGTAEQFAKLFGDDLNHPCSKVFTAKLTTTAMTACEGTDISNAAGEFIMTGLIANQVSIVSTINEAGILYYNATASFLISGLQTAD